MEEHSVERELELEAINAIYPGYVECLSDTQWVVQIPRHEHVRVHMSFPTGYPTEAAPQVLDVVAPEPRKQLVAALETAMERAWLHDVCIFDFLAEASDACDAHAEDSGHVNHDITSDEGYMADGNRAVSADASSGTTAHELPDLPAVWIQSDPVVDRGSTFVAFAASVSSEADACAKLDQLRADGKIARSQHVITAWRIHGAGSVVYQDCDDDGETAAGGRVLHLLTLMDAWDVVVAVVRWFGGAHIGPDRFKHINSTAREAVLRGEFADPSKAGKKKK